MRLQPPEIQILLRAVEASFDPFSMDQLLETRFGLKLHNLTGIVKAFGHQAIDIHRYFDQRNRTEELIAVLRDARPSEPTFVTLADQAGFAQLPSQGGLDALVRKSGRMYQDVVAFRSQLSKLEAAVCRVETPGGYGTGFLIGQDLVLTNHHVIADTLDDYGTLIQAATCLFDYKQGGGDYVTPGLSVPVSSVLAKSPHSQNDLSSQSENVDPTKLDYAILRLTRELATSSVVSGGDARGFIPIAASPRTVNVSDGLVILQHPKAKPMKLDIGAVTWVGTTRMRHTVNTEGGSSGSPVFGADLELVALHHAGYDWPQATYPYNQAIPLTLVAAHARAQGLSI